MELSFEMHRESLVSVTSGLQSTTDFAYFHVLVLLLLSVVDDSFEFSLLFLEFVNFCHDGLCFFNLTFLTKLLCILIIEIDLSFELVYFQISSVLLSSVHLRLIHRLVIFLSGLWTILSPGKTSLDLLVHLSHHLGQLHNELVLIFPFETLLVTILNELRFQVVIMSALARSNVCLRVREEIVRAEGEKVELADVLIVEVISSGKSNE